MSKQKLDAYPFAEMSVDAIMKLKARIEQVAPGTPCAEVLRLLQDSQVPASIGESGGPAHRLARTYFLSRRVLLTLYEDCTAPSGPVFVGFELSGLKKKSSS